MSAKSDYVDALQAFTTAFDTAIAAHETLRATYAAAGGVEGGNPTEIPDLLFKPLCDCAHRASMVAAWQQRVTDAQGWLSG